jgi:repressor LexA
MSLEQASEIQQRMYDFIELYINREGMPPTNREIGRAMNIASTGHVDYHLTMLEKKGCIIRQAKKSRGIKLVVPARKHGVPVQGYIAAGEPLDIYTDAFESVDMGSGIVDTQDAYALVVRGHSMIEDHICSGDYVVIKRQETCQNGDIVVALHLEEGVQGSATLKRFFQEKEHDRVRLQPANSELDPIFIPKNVWDREWKIQGRVIAILRQCSGSAA